MTDPIPLPAPPATTMEEAVARMEAIAGQLPEDDGVACFNRVYLAVTQDVAAHVGQGYFADPLFITRLDVVFANIYFAAVDALTTSPDDLPGAWAPLLQARSTPGIEAIQFALAGFNSHINHDLPLAVVDTCLALATTPDAGSYHGDYQKVDQLLFAAEQSVRQSFESGLVLAADRHLEAVANLVANWNILTARNVAWDTALALWDIRTAGFARDLLLASLTRTVGMVSRVLLAPV